MTMKDKLASAGALPPDRRLYLLAVKCLQGADGVPTRAVEGFLDGLRAEPDLLLALLAKDEIGQPAWRYLNARAQEMAGKPARGGQSASDSHLSGAPATKPRPGGHPGTENHIGGAAPGGGANGAGHLDADIQTTGARPVSVRAHNRRTPEGHAALTKSFWDQKLGLFDITLKTATRQDFVNLKRKGMVVDHIADRALTEIDWPDDVTPLPEVATQAQVEAILASGRKLLGSLGIAKVKEVGHAA